VVQFRSGRPFDSLLCQGNFSVCSYFTGCKREHARYHAWFQVYKFAPVFIIQRQLSAPTFRAFFGRAPSPSALAPKLLYCTVLPYIVVEKTAPAPLGFAWGTEGAGGAGLLELVLAQLQ
jgi:hypothetical protein